MNSSSVSRNCVRDQSQGNNATPYAAYACVFTLLAFASLPALSQQSNSLAPPPRNGGDFSDNVSSGNKVPTGVILVKGAWSGASDSTTPVPEDGNIANNIFTNKYFGITYALPADWEETYKGPPPSETGRYVLAQIGPSNKYRRPDRGTILITAQDMFFTPFPAENSLDLVKYSRKNLEPVYKLELPPTPTTIAGKPFDFYAYWSPAAELHWYMLTTEIRCHAIQIMMNSRDTKLLESLVLDLNKMRLPDEADPVAGTGGGTSPVCVKDYANGENVTTRVEPIFTEHHFNAVPVRIIVGKDGKVKYIHFLSAFPDQAKVITDALKQWKLKPYTQGGKPVEVETGLMFGRSPFPTQRRAANAAAE